MALNSKIILFFSRKPDLKRLYFLKNILEYYLSSKCGDYDRNCHCLLTIHNNPIFPTSLELGMALELILVNGSWVEVMNVTSRMKQLRANV